WCSAFSGSPASSRCSVFWHRPVSPAPAEHVQRFIVAKPPCQGGCSAVARTAPRHRLLQPMRLTWPGHVEVRGRLVPAGGGNVSYVRIWRTRLDLDRVDEYDQWVEQRSKDMFRAQQGFQAVIYTRSGEHVAVLSFWNDDAGRSTRDLAQLPECRPRNHRHRLLGR